METIVSTDPAVAVASAFLQALNAHDFAAATSHFHPDATWDHHNQDRFGKVHRGLPEIAGFMSEAMQLTAGNLRPEPLLMLADGRGHVAVQFRFNASRPDGRSTADRQVLVFTIEGDRVRAVDHYIGDPAAVAAFWA